MLVCSGCRKNSVLTGSGDVSISWQWLHKSPDPAAAVCLLIQEGGDQSPCPKAAFAIRKGKTYPSFPPSAPATAVVVMARSAAGVFIFMVW